MRIAGAFAVVLCVLSLAGCGGSDASDLAAAPGGIPALPTLAFIAPTSGPPAGGTVVTLTGTNFTPGSQVTFGGALAASVAFVNGTTLTATTPAGTGTVDVTVATGQGSATLFGAFSYGPTLTSVAPTSGSAGGGTAITLTGTNFSAPAEVRVDGNGATGVVVVNATTITATTPAGTGTVDVSVETDGGTATLVGAFTYIAPPTLTAVAQDWGTTAGGTPVTLTGTGFVANAAGPNAVTFGGAPAAGIVTVNDTTITCTTPAGVAGPVDVEVSNANGVATLVGGFEYVTPLLYAADGKGVGNNGLLYRIDPATAAATTLGPIGFGVTGMAFSPTGVLYGVTAGGSGFVGFTANAPLPRLLITLNTSSGEGTVVGPLVDAALNPIIVADVTFVGTRLLGVARDVGSAASGVVVEIDVSTGEVTPIGPAADLGNMLSVAADGLGAVFHWRNDVADTLDAVDATTGVRTTGPAVVSANGFTQNAMTFLAGTLYGSDTSGPFGVSTLVTIPLGGGPVVVVGALPPSVDAIAGTVP